MFLYFFQVGAPFCIEKAKYWPLSAHFFHKYTHFCCPFYRLKKSGGVPELTIYRVCWGGAEHTFVSKYVKFEDDYKRKKKYGWSSSRMTMAMTLIKTILPFWANGRRVVGFSWSSICWGNTSVVRRLDVGSGDQAVSTNSHGTSTACQIPSKPNYILRN